MKIIFLALLISFMAQAALGDRATKVQEIDPALEKEFERKELEKKMLVEKERQKKIEAAKKIEDEKKRKEQAKIDEKKRRDKEKIVQELLDLKKRSSEAAEDKRKKGSEKSAPLVNAVKSQPATVGSGEEFSIDPSGKKIYKCKDTDLDGNFIVMYHAGEDTGPRRPNTSCKEVVRFCKNEYSINKGAIGLTCLWHNTMVFYQKPNLAPKFKYIHFDPKRAKKFRDGLKFGPKICDNADKMKDPEFVKKNCNPKFGMPNLRDPKESKDTVVKCPETGELGVHYMFYLKGMEKLVQASNVTCQESVENCEENFKAHNIGYRCYWNQKLVFWREALE